ncbi:MAG: HlyC/CorC family transporter [Pseudomonadota bacterium]|jgi:Mg2+/Co2+ transporter CorB|nr:HlyC/CorC family transporter [Pseudomonadota bacterium]
MLFWALGVLIVLSAFFSGSETALMTLNRYRLQHLVKEGHRGALRAQKLLQRPDRLIGLILLGNNFVNILASSLTTVIAIRLGGEASIAVGAGILTLVILIFAEVAPKTMAAMHPERLAFPASWVFICLLRLAYPVVWAINTISNLVLKIFRCDPSQQRSNILSKEELRTIVSNTDSLLPKRYQNMLVGILDLETATVEDVMVPRNEIVGLDIGAPLDELVAQIKTSPHTRIPVYKKSIDRVIGILHLRKVLPRINDENLDKKWLYRALNKTYFIPESTPLHSQLMNFKTEKNRMGLVVDEYGEVQGVVTLEDLLQEIVGGIITSPSDVRIQKDGSYLVDASVTLRDLNRLTGWSLPTEGPKTLNGLIIEFLETIPVRETSLVLFGYRLEILEVDEHAVQMVKFYAPQNWGD